MIRDLPPAHDKGIRKTLVRGADGEHYTIYTFRLYDRPPGAEFPNYEVNVIRTDAEGRYRVLVQPFFQRFSTEEEARAMHERLLREFDTLLKLQPHTEA